MGKSGFVTLAGRPNVGKSTLINRLVGDKIAITSPRPQTTRNRIVGVLNGDDFQVALIDTPGVGKHGSKLARSLANVAVKASHDSDILLFISDGRASDPDGDRSVLGRLKSSAPKTILAINKIDLVKKGRLLEQIERFNAFGCFDEIIPVSAKTGENVDKLIELIRERLPEGPLYYPAGIKTDQPEVFIIGEIIREKAIFNLQNELPYSLAVIVDAVEDRSSGLTAVAASIFVERQSQKGIVIGKKGSMLKKIGAAARMELEARLKTKVFLDLAVKVKEKWTSDSRSISDFGYGLKE
ncbi:GTP-binding protein Era [hydrothermal vent metagenome]|uniref:GTP-binding protein Era n=1 Tax=hydrothermal vent metagenome TaxID=652676 RepID=A0A3B1CF40_9ZZZZ